MCIATVPYIRFFFLMLALLFLTNSSMAAPATTSVPIDAQQLQNMIDTLENDAAREKFIANLKTLNRAYAQQSNDGVLQFSELLGLSDTTQTLLQRYDAFIKRHRLNSSVLGKLALSFMGLLTVALLVKLLRIGRQRAHRAVQALLKRYHLTEQRYHGHIQFLYSFALIGLICGALYSLLVIWGMADFSSLAGQTGRAIISTALNIFLVLAFAFALWEISNGLIETALRRVDGVNSRRMQTLLPVARNVMRIVFGVVFSLMILSELGIEIMPLLAGAGIVGIAVGFGAQTLVRDFLSGFMVILEDLIQVGDVVTVAGHSGLVEKITIRKVELRDLEGIVHTVPFSQINIIENRTKDFSCYVLDIGVAYREDTDRVIQLLRNIDTSMRQDPAFKDFMLEPLEIFGVDRFADSAVIIKGRLKTIPLKQWDIGREFNRRMKQQFDANNIEIPFPHRTLYFGHARDGTAPTVDSL